MGKETARRLLGAGHSVTLLASNAEKLQAAKEELAPLGDVDTVVVGQRSVLGSITGTPYDNERAFDFSVLTGVRPWIETTPLERAVEAYKKMKSGDVKFRMVLTMKEPRVAH